MIGIFGCLMVPTVDAVNAVNSELPRPENPKPLNPATYLDPPKHSTH